MALVRVVVLGTIGKGVLLDTSLPARVTALEAAATAARSSGVTSHHALTGLQDGDDHPQYAMNAAAETITGPWNFAREPAIFGSPLSEFVEDTIGNELENSASIYLTYSDYGLTTGKITAHINPEYLEDFIAATLCDSPTIAFDHYDTRGCIRAHLTATLGDLLDVEISTLPAYGDVLTFNGFEWVPLPAGSGSGVVISIVAGTGITVDSTDPAHPIVAATGSGGGVASVVAGTGISVNSADPANPIVSVVGEYIEDTVASILCDSPTIAFDHYDTAGCVRAHLTATLDDLLDVDVPTLPAYGDVLTFNGFEWHPAPSGGAGGPIDGNRIIAGYATLLGNVGGGWNGYTVAMKVLGGGILTKAAAWKLTIGHTTANMTIAAAKLRRVARDSTTYLDSTTITWGGSATPTLAAGRNTSDTINVTMDPQYDYYILVFIDAATSASMAPSGPSSHPFYGTLLTFGYLLGNHTADATFTGYTATGQNVFQPELFAYNP